MSTLVESSTGSEAARVHLYCRETLPAPVEKRPDDVTSRLSTLEQTGVVKSYERHTWPTRVPLAECSDDLRETYLEFSVWAATTDRLLTPFFTVRECYLPGEPERTDWIALPALCLAIYRGDTLEAVYPHRDESDYWTVEDALDHLERAAIEPSSRDQPTTAGSSVLSA